jgi:hypothetical protein
MHFIRRYRTSVWAALAVGLVCLAGGTWLDAQTTSASVQGSVRDAQGGAAAKAQIVLTSNTQGSVLTTTTDTRGNYTFPVVRPDTYTLKISLPGFKSVEMRRVVVNANDKYSAGITTLQVSQQEETITVEGRAVEIQASSGERSYTLESAALQSIAVGDRSPYALIGLTPGVKSGTTQGGPNRDQPTGISWFSANGARTNSNNLTIDGITNLDTGDNGSNMVTTNLDTIAEFKVLTSSYQAEYGRAVGAQIQVVTKSGGQDFHGSAYWYQRHNKWNANGWLNNRNGNKRDETAKRNDFGATLGGPIFIPGKFNQDKKKLFFFASLEMQRRKDPVGATNVLVPTALERQGDFSQSLINGNPANLLKDYQSPYPCTADDHRGCFADGGVLGKIPANRLYKPSLAVLSLYPDPNVTGQPSYNYTSQEPADQPVNQVLLRVDYHLSDNWRVMGRYMKNSDPNWQPLGVSWAAGGNIPMSGYRHLPGYNWMFSVNGTLNSTTSLEVEVGSAHNFQEIGSEDPRLHRDTTVPGITDIPLLFPEATTGYIPRFNWGGLIGNGATLYTQQAPFVNWNTTIDALANITKIAGAHVFKGGLYFQQSKKPQSPFAPFNGQITFANGGGNIYDTGNPYANAAIGAYQGYTQASRYAYPMYKYHNYEAYIQDNWRPTRRLTLDYGVRFYLMTPQDDAETKLISNFFPDEWSASAAPRLYTPVCIGAYPCSGANRRGMDPSLVSQGVAPATGNTVVESFIGRIVPGSGQQFNGSGKATDTSMFDGNATRISPRIGFAYDLNGRQTAILRGGFGIFFDRPQGNTRFDMVGNPPGVSQPNLGNGLLQDLAAALAAAGSVPAAVSGSNPSEYEFTLPTVYAWNIGAQVKLPSSFVLDVSYVGNKATKLLGQKQINALPYGTTYKPENQDPTRTSGALGTTAKPYELLRPYPGYGTIRMWGSVGESNYNALQTTLQRRFDNGLMVGVSYTFSKTLGTGTSDYSGMRIDGRDRELNYGILQSDQPHNFVANFVYQTPKFAKGALGAIANGWQISGIFRYASGYPYAINVGFKDGTGNNVLTGSEQGARVVLVGDPGPGWSDDPYAQVNQAAFAPPKTGSIGAESSQFFVRTKPLQNLDLSLSKSFQLAGSAKFEVRLDAFNALNKVNIFGVNNTIQFASLSDPTVTNGVHRPDGTTDLRGGFGAVNNVYPGRTLQLVTRLTF